MNEAIAYREYDPEKAAAAPKAQPNMIDLLVATSAMRFWSMKSPHTLKQILEDGYWTEMVDIRLKQQDRIEIVSECYARQPVHATLVVSEAERRGKVSVALLHRFERQ